MPQNAKRRLTLAHAEAVAGEVPVGRASAGSASASGGVRVGTTEIEGGEEELLRVGELAQATGKTVRAIHLYEDLGLLEPARRSKGHYRLFMAEAKTRVRWISKLQSLGLSLTEIQALVERRNTSESAMRAAQELGRLYEVKLHEVESKIEELTALRAELVASLEFLKRCDVSCEDELSAHECASCSRHARMPSKPELVAGAHLD